MGQGMSKYKLGDYTVKHWNDWDRVPRMPTLFAQAIGNYILGSLAIQASLAAAAAVGYLAIALVTSWAINALAPPMDFGAAMDRGLLTNIKGATNPQHLVYGEVRKGGTITYVESTGAANNYLHQVICLAGHEVHEIGDIYINDQVVTLDDDGYVTDARWTVVDEGVTLKKIQILKFTGADDQDIYSTITGASSPVPSYERPNWKVNGSNPTSNEDVNFKGEGIACLYVKYRWDANVFAEGIPLITAMIKGKKVYDPRTSTTSYSANAALCVRDYITQYYGLDNNGDTNDTAFSAAANTCDETVSLAGSGDENRYEINGIVSLDESPQRILSDMMTACAGTLFWGQGAWHLKVGEYNSAVKTFTLDDLRSPINLETKHSRRDNFNIVRGTFVDANQDYIASDYPEIRSTTFISNDNGVENAIDLKLPFTTSSSMAQRLAKMTLFRAREQMTFTADFGLEAFEVECGDIIALTIDRYGWTAKEFEVVGWKFKNDGDAGDLRVALTLRETSSAAFDWNAEESDITGNDSTLPDPTVSLTIATLTTSGGGRTTSDGTFINSVIVSWAAPANSFVTHYEVEWKATADSNYAATSTTGTSIELSPLVDGIEYTIRVRAVTSSGRRGPFTSATFTGGGDTTAPAKPTNISATGGYKYIRLDWTDPADLDFNFVEIYEGDSTSATEGPELITDGDFSESSFASVDNVANWTVTKQNSSDTLFIVESASYHGSGVQRINVVDFGTTAIGSLSQNISTVSGETYTLRYTSDSSQTPSGVFVVITGSSQISSNEITATGSTEVEIEFTANSSTTEIKFDVQETDADAIFTLVSVKANDPLTKVGTSSGTSFTRTNLGLSQTKYYFLKSVDFTGNKSAFTSPVSATTAFLDNDDFENGVRQLFIDQGKDIIEPVASLAGRIGEYVNQQVFLTTTGKLYYWNGSSWSETVAGIGDVDFDDLQGTISAAQIVGRVVGADNIVANSIDAGVLAASGVITSAAMINNGVIENAKIQNLAVERAKIGNNAANEVYGFTYQNNSLANASPFTDDFDETFNQGDYTKLSFTLDFEGNSATNVDVIVQLNVTPIGSFPSNSINYKYVDIGANNFSISSRYAYNELRSEGSLAGSNWSYTLKRTFNSTYDGVTMAARFGYASSNIGLNSSSTRGWDASGIVWVRYR